MLTRFTVILLMPLVVATTSQGATLTRNGKATSVIVVPDKSSRVADDAAELLQRILSRMSGTTIPIQAESKIGGTPSAERAWLSVGETRFARLKGIAPDKFKPEEIRVVAAAEYLIVIGNERPAGDTGRDTQQGTYFAAVELLERLGVRWLWPGKSGEVVPHLGTVAMQPLTYSYAPPVGQRKLRYGPDRGDGQARYGVNIKEAGLDWDDWPYQMRLGSSRRIQAGHSFGDWYEKFFKTHPEYFAIGPDGKSFGWLSNVQRSKLCVSNPGVLEEVVKEAKEYYARATNKQATCFSVSPTDNQAGHCMCENCRKMDALDGPKESWNFATGAGGKVRSMVHHVSLTDRYVTFWNRVAERLEKECPNLLLSGNAYGVYRHPPLHTNVHKNIVITYVGMSYASDSARNSGLNEWDQWATRAKHLMFRPNLMKEGQGFPLLWPVRLAEDLKHFSQTGMIAVDFANIHGHWATQGLNYYVLAKALWNPTLDPKAIIDDYCERGFGPAAGPIRNYFMRLIQLTDQFAGANAGSRDDVAELLARQEATTDDGFRPRRQAGQGASAWVSVYTPAVMKELEGYLTAAKQRAASQPAVRERVDFVAKGFEFAKLDLVMKQALSRWEQDPKSREKIAQFLEAVVNEEQWRKRNARSSAVGTVIGSYWFSQQLLSSPAARFAPMVLAKKTSGDAHELTVLAYSRDRRVTHMQLSADGKAWSEARPYETHTAWKGEGKVFVRFRLEDEDGATWSKPIEAAL